MKWIMLLSLGLNFLLGYQLMTRRPVVTTEERIIVKKSKPKIIERKIFVEVPVKKVAVPGSTAAGSTTTIEYDENDMEDLVGKVTQDRDDFLSSELGMNPPEYQKIQQVKEKFNRRYQEVIPPDHYGDLSIEQRRRLLALDEEREAEFSRVVGDKKWKQFQKFRDEYNRKMFSKQVNEKGMIIPMEI